MTQTTPSKAIVIGAGLGGIAVAGRLARLGYQVDVYEKAATPGGRVAVIEKDGYRFDVGPTLFLMPAVFAETYAALGESMERHLDLERVDPTYRIHFHDGSHLDLTSDLVQMRDRLEALEPGSFSAYMRFLAEGYRHYHLALQKFVGRNFYSLFEFLSPANLPLLFQMKALIKHASNTGRYFRDPRLRAAFTFQNMYLGLSPFDAPATYSLLQYTELAEGVWFPRGGLFRVIESLVGVAQRLGVRFHYNTPVQSIEVSANRAEGVRLADGELQRAELVIANADLPYVYSDLLPEDGYVRRLAGKKYTSSALMFFWGMRGARSSDLLHHNLFLADHRYRTSFESIFRDHSLPAEPSFYLNLPSRSEPGFAPQHGDGILALVPVGHLDETKSQDWGAWQERARAFIFKRLSGLGIQDPAGRLEFEASWGPPYYRNVLNLAKGSAFGLSHNFTQVGYFRPHNRHARYQNLYFAGASTHPGTGLPIVLLSARLVTERIQRECPPPARKSIGKFVAADPDRGSPVG